MCEYARWILNTADRSGVPVLEPQSSIYSRRRRSSILDCSEMENREHQYHNWKRNRSTKPPWKNWNIVESLLRSLSLCWSPVMFERIFITSACAAVPHLWKTRIMGMSEGFYFIATEAWSLSSLLWSFFQVRELCQQTLTNTETQCFRFRITLVGIRYKTFTQARNTEFKLESAGYVERDTWFVNETERFLLTLSTLPCFAEHT